jgi:hypothetical protein
MPFAFSVKRPSTPRTRYCLHPCTIYLAQPHFESHSFDVRFALQWTDLFFRQEDINNRQ